MSVWLEPTCFEFPLKSGESLQFVGESAHDGQFEVVEYADRIGVYEWPGASIRVYREGKLVEEFEPFSEDPIPSGASFRSFVEGAFGGPGCTGNPDFNHYG
jgi:hypothetical protein